MKLKRKNYAKGIIILLVAVAILVGNIILKTSGISSLITFLTGYFLICVGLWKLLFPQSSNNTWLTGLVIIFLGLFIVFLSMLLPSILFSL